MIGTRISALFLAVLCGPAPAQEILVVTLPATCGGEAAAGAIRFELIARGAVLGPEGISYRGSASVPTGGGPLVLAEAELLFSYRPGTTEVQMVRGLAVVPAPLSTKGKPVRMDDVVKAELGYGCGEVVKKEVGLGVPLLDKRSYLYFKFDAGLTIRYGEEGSGNLEEEENPSFSISFPAGAMSRIVVDPLDPMFYFSGSVTTPKSKQGPENRKPEDEVDDGITAGSGTSQRGLFPFEPFATWGIEDKAMPFLGHRVVTGTFPLYSLPGLVVRGQMIANLDPLATGELAIDPFGIGLGPVVRAGANGRLLYSLDFLHVAGLGNFANLTIPIGKATAAVEIVNDRQLAYISGIVEPDTDLGLGLLLAQDGQLKASGLASTNLAEIRLYLEGRYKVGMSEVAKLAKLNLGNLIRTEAILRADRNGFFLKGISESGVNMGPLSSRDKVTVEMEIPANKPETTYAQLTGLIELAGMGVNGMGRASSEGIAVSGNLDVPKWRMGITAGVAAGEQGLHYVHGSMTVPAALQPEMQAEVRLAAKAAQQELDRLLAEFQKATRDYEFELSLRGMRTVVPGMVDTIVSTMNSQIAANLNRYWPRINTFLGPVEAPGKSEGLRVANQTAEPHRVRLRELKRLVQSGDSATVREALERELLYWLSGPRLNIGYRVPVAGVTIPIYDAPLLDERYKPALNLALAGVRALPAVSAVNVRAETVWSQAPKHEILRQLGTAIETNATAAIPKVESIGFRFPLGRLEWEYQVVVTAQGRRTPLIVNLRPETIGSIGVAIGKALTQAL